MFLQTNFLKSFPCLNRTMIRLLASHAFAAQNPKIPPPKMVTITVDGKKIQAAEGTILVDALKKAGFDIPTMCYHPDLKDSGGICRICVVEDKTRNNALLISCRTLVTEGMDITTNSHKIAQIRQTNTALMFGTHPNQCLSCPQSGKCEVQQQSSKSNIHSDKSKEILACTKKKSENEIDESSALVRDMDLCIGCDRCIQACKTQCGALQWSRKDGEHTIETFGNMSSNECIQCGQCINRCPTGALKERTEINEVIQALKDQTKHIVFQIAPAIRVSIAEEFGLKPGERMIKNELVTALKMLGPNVTVLDTDFSADLTIMEEAAELVERISRKILGKKFLSDAEKLNIDLPMFTSCCPAWVTYMEKNYPDMLSHMSTCKSPMQMQSALIKTYWAKQVKKIDPKNVIVIAIMPCIAKKEEKDRPDMRTGEFKYTDYVITTREFARLLKQYGIDPTKLPKTDFDRTMGVSSGAGVIFAASGGVLEAALRTAYEIITGREVPFKNLEITPIRGVEGIREAKIKFEKVKPEFAPLEGFEFRVAVAHQMSNAKDVVELIKLAKKEGKQLPWHLVEVMVCPGGCLGGGGQPKPTSMEIRKARASLVYGEDRNLPIRKSHENPEVKALYDAYLKHPLSHESHELLHRGYTEFKGKYRDTFNPADAKGIEKVLDKYEKNRQDNLLPIIIDEVDRKGFLSGASVVKIADHLGVNPVRVASVVSHYHYFPRKKQADTQIYMCTCHNCSMHGHQKVYDELQKISSTQNPKQFELHKMNWLGVCVNDAPAAMVKRTGTNYVEFLTGLSTLNILSKISNIQNSLIKTPPNNIQIYPFARRLTTKIPHISMLDEFPTELLENVLNQALSWKSEKIIGKLANAKLEGRGGAGFPTYKKWEAVKNAEIKQNISKYIVCNADEGLPSTFKDWWILSNEHSRRRVIAGIGICAKTVGAKKAFIYLRYEYRNLLPEIYATIAQIKNMNPALSEIQYEVRLGGGPYVAGEETAQFESIQGAPPIPRKDRPWNVFATQQGLFHSPTVINNVETFFSVPYIMHHDEEIIKKVGLPKILGVTGNIEKPALLEYALHSEDKPTIRKIIAEIKASDIIAAEVGGATEPLIFSKDFDKPLGFGWNILNAVGSIVLFNKNSDLTEAYIRKLEFMVDESCKQCVPCRDGSKLLKDNLRAILLKQKAKVSKETMKRVAEAAAWTSICAHGKALGNLYNAAYDYATKNNN